MMKNQSNKFQCTDKFKQHTSKPTTFSMNNITGGLDVCSINSRILRNENARASPDCFCRPNHMVHNYPLSIL